MASVLPFPPTTARIATLCLNPTIDTAFEADEVLPTRKTRTFNERVDPGGGGINVARVLERFGAGTSAIFLAGGHTGQLLDNLLCREGVEREGIPIAGDTRLSVTVFDRSARCEYRFVPEGPLVSEAEWQALLDRAESLDCDYLVASGSLPPGAPDDFYVRLRSVLPSATRYVLDTSGSELRAALRDGGIFLVKPSKGELEELVGEELPTNDHVLAAARRIVAAGSAEYVAVTLGRDGAVLANNAGAEFVPAPAVPSLSAVGAGDSFLAAMVYAFAAGMDGGVALRLAVAAGAASTLNPGTGLCDPDDVQRLYDELRHAR